jgi:hypothetical protein
VGVILILRDYSRHDKNDDGEEDDTTVEVPDALGHFCEMLVGLFMLFLGVYGFRRALRKRHEFQGRIALSSSEDGDGEEEFNDEPIPADDGKESTLRQTTNGPYHDHPSSLEAFADIVAEEYPESSFELGAVDDSELPACRGCGSLVSFSRRFSIRTMAFLAGIIHGLAGPGGVLGVIPAVQLHDWKLATLYLGCFCVSSTITMGCFASFYGLCSSSVGKRTNLEFQIHCFSSGLSILVGITWLTLLSMGKLEDVFP